MDTFFIIILIICLAVQIPVWIFYFLNKKEIDKEATKQMMKKYPTYPKVKVRENHFASFPLSLWNS